MEEPLSASENVSKALSFHVTSSENKQTKRTTTQQPQNKTQKPEQKPKPITSMNIIAHSLSCFLLPLPFELSFPLRCPSFLL